MSRRVAAAVLAPLLLPGVVLAAAPWSEPVTVSRPHLFISAPGVAVTADGTAVATWGWQDGTRLASAKTGSRVAYRPAGGVWSAERSVSGSVAGPPVTFGKRSWAVPTQTFSPARLDRSSVGVVVGTAERTPAARKPLFTGRTLSRVQLAGSPRGHLALVWMQRRGGRRDRVFIADRAPGQRFSKPRVLVTGRVRNVSAAVSEAGDVLVAWDARGVVRARIRRVGASRFGGARTIASKPASTRDLRTAISPTGRAYVAWTAQFGSEGGETGPIYVQGAVRRSGAATWSAQLLDRLGRDKGVRGLALDMPPGGRDATVAWVGHDGASYRVRTAATTPAGTFGAARELPGGAGDFAVDDLDGGTLMLTRFFGSDAATGSQVMASHDLGAPEPVSAEQEAYDGHVAADPRGGVTAVWINRPAGSRHPIGEIRTVLQSASRP